MRTPLLSTAPLALVLVSFATLITACEKSDDGQGAAGSAGQSGQAGAAGDGAAGDGAAGGDAGAAGDEGAGGAAGQAGAGGSSGGQPGSSGSSGQGTAGSGSPAAGPLSPTTFVFQRDVGEGNEHLVAMDYASGESRVLATLAEGSIKGWGIDGVSVSPDRTRIVLAAPYGATTADVATGLSTNALWSLDAEGGDMKRLTPTFKNPKPGQSGFWIDVRGPHHTLDGSQVVFDYGEGTAQGGYVAPWAVGTGGGSQPALIDLPKSGSCSVNGNVVFQPGTGDMLVNHTVCIPGEASGYFLYPAAGGEPVHLVDDSDGVYSSDGPTFSADGTVFAFTARPYADSIQSLYVYLMSDKKILRLIPGDKGRDIVSAAFAPDNVHVVYCESQGGARNLHVVDLGADPITDKALTTDGVSCDPVF